MAGILTRLVGFKLRVKNKNKPKVIERHQNDIVINWEHVFESEKNKKIYVLQLCDKLKQWVPIYWGSKTEVRIENLAPCTCYQLRLKLENENQEHWIYFKVATDSGLYSVMHMARAVSLSKMAQIRKIVQQRHELLEMENKEHKTPLIQAIKHGNIQVVNLLLTLGADINNPICSNKRTPLMFAVYYGQLQIALILIQKGCNINLVDVNGLNALHHAVDSNNVENVSFALNMGLDVNCKDNSGWTPLLRSIILNCDADIVNLLFTKDADKSIKDNNGFDYEKHCILANYKLNNSHEPIINDFNINENENNALT